MPDVEKVIKGLTCRLECGCMNEDHCNPECPYLEDPRACYGLDEDAIALLKAQEHPTDECIRNAIFCLQNPHDCLETEVDEARKMSFCALKAREPKMVDGVAEIDKDILVGNCPSCGGTIVSDIKNPTKYCRFCGQGVKWE